LPAVLLHAASSPEAIRVPELLERLQQALADRYRIEQELGVGGMATVWLAHDLKHDRDVALKVLRPELAAVLGAERFLSEIRITAKLDHPHILTLIDSGEAGGLLYYVLPYVHGESLRAKLEREKQLGVEEALRITRQVALALGHAHRHGVIHRDIKPENILLFEGEAMLADFGIALAVREAGGNRLTESGLSLGTPQYMSPEQATGDRTLDARSDVYSLGAVLYEMLAGEPPVTGPTVQVLIAKLLTERPVRLRTVRETVPERLDGAVAKALAKVPADRFATAADFAAALEAAGAAPTSAPTRRRWLVPAAAAAGVAALALALVLLRGRPAAPPSEPERVQITFTGIATVPAVSEDGRRVAYATRRCAADGRCTEDLVVQDVGGAGAATVLRGAVGIWSIDWTADGRYLVFRGSFGGDRWGAFSIPSLGGAPLSLGCCFATMIGAGDTVLVTAAPSPGDSLNWVRWVTVADGAVRDSVLVPRTGPGNLIVHAFPGGRRLMLAQWKGGGVALYTLDRSRQRLDSVLIETRSSWHGPAARLTSDGGAFLIWIPRERTLGVGDLLRYRVAGDGRIARAPDTLVRGLQIIAGGAIARSGMVAFGNGPLELSLWALRRDSPGSMRFVQRRLASATGRLGGLVSPAGDRVLVVRGVVTGGRRLSQLSLMPFDSGPESPLGPPQDLADVGWDRDGASVLVAARRGTDTVGVSRFDLASGRSRPLATFAAEDFDEVIPMPGGGFLLLSRSERELRRIGIPGLADTTFHPPAGMTHFMHVSPSPDGREAALAGWTDGWDSVLVHRMPLMDGSARLLAAFTPEGVSGVRWLTDGTLIVQIEETSWNLAWYRLPAEGGPAVRLGAVPRYPADYRLSADGRRAVALVEDARTDVWLIRGLAEVLKR
jgi:hypothetical protein